MTALIAVLPYHLRHEKDLGRLPLTSIEFPLGQEIPPEKISVSDLGKSDHLIVYCCSTALVRSHRPLNCKVSMLIAEPEAVQRRYYVLSLFFWKKFHKILTYSSWLLKILPNALFHIAPTAWVEPIQHPSKTSLLSIIASKKKQLPGQKVRHAFIRACQSRGVAIDLYGRGYREVEKKEEALSDYMFSVVTENCSENNYFSEKLIDCLLQKVVPVYWGAPNIAEFFNPEGIIRCGSLEELLQACINLSEETYISKYIAIEENYEIAKGLNSVMVAAALKVKSNE